MSTEYVTPGTGVAVRTLPAYPGFTFHKAVSGYAYALNGQSKPGMQGHGTPRYRWTVKHNGGSDGSGPTLKYVREIADMILNNEVRYGKR